MSTATALRLTVNRKALLIAFGAVSSVVPARSPKPILQSLKLTCDPESGSTLAATDLEVAISARVLGVQIASPGSVILPTVRMQQILTTSTDEYLDIEVEGDILVVRGARSKNPDLFPEVPDFPPGPHYWVAAHALRRLIRRTMFATDVESTRYALGGCLVEVDGQTIAMVGTDGRRLAKQVETVDSAPGATPPGTTVLPVKALKLIDRNIDDDDPPVHLAFGPNSVLIRTANAVIYTRLVEGRFPRYQDVFPATADVRIPVEVGALRSVVGQAMIVTSDESRGVDFDFAPDALTLASKAADVGSSQVEMALAYDGKSVPITFDPRYLMDMLKVLEDDAVLTVELIDHKNAAVFRTADGYSVVVMPLTRER